MSAPMTLQCDLTDSPLNLSLLREFTRRELLKIFTTEIYRRPDEGVVLVLDPQLIGPLGLMVSHREFLIEELRVEKVYKLEESSVDYQAPHVVFLTRPDAVNAAIIGDQVLRSKSQQRRQNFYALFVPRVTLVCERIFSDYEIFDDLHIFEFNLDFVPYDIDLLCLEIPNAFCDYNLHGDYTSLHFIAKSMLKFQNLYGFIPQILGKGHSARQLVDLMVRIRRENSSHEAHVLPEVHKMIIIDRAADTVTPLCTQLTYEGLVDEVFTIHNSCVDLPSELIFDPNTKKQMPPGRVIETPLNSNDSIFKDIRDSNISVVGSILNERTRIIDEYYQGRHAAANDMSIFKTYMTGFGDVQKDHMKLQMHIEIATEVVNVTRSELFRRRLEMEQILLCEANPAEVMQYILECIDKQEPLLSVLKLVCLASITLDGIESKTFDLIRDGIVQSYGFTHMYTLENLIELGMLKRAPTIKFSEFTRISREMNLIVQDLNEHSPNDISYVFSGYAPISVRLIEEALRSRPVFDKANETVTYEGWGGRYDDSRLPGGPFFRTKQHLTKELTPEEGSC
eukprot:TRINITY_DN1938_c0_g2_i1.p1 TRINITY_DN1938_c0_g2~~TRINITY_DN1938_c0_g2_i1.p1  ORF type:complete len:566 (+),score=117.41 TRINITY_DN1938_c0_g2_i1:83-1780(+)